MKLDLIGSPEFIVFTTRDYAHGASISVVAASKQLARLRQDNKTLVQLTRGIWANIAHTHFNPLACVPIILGREQGYVSFLSALHSHGIVSQIPTTIQVATTGHSRKLKTPVATYELLQVKPEMLSHGVEWSDTPRPYLVASAEKALLDTLYISTRKNKRFAKLPELALTDPGFSVRRFNSLLRTFALPLQIVASIEARLSSYVRVEKVAGKSRRASRR